MRVLIGALPKRDCLIAEKLINNREFESLLELVNSDIYKIEKKCNPASVEESNLELESTLNDLCKLRNEIESYLMILGYSEEEIYGNAEDSECEDDSFYEEEY